MNAALGYLIVIAGLIAMVGLLLAVDSQRATKRLEERRRMRAAIKRLEEHE